MPENETATVENTQIKEEKQPASIGKTERLTQVLSNGVINEIGEEKKAENTEQNTNEGANAKATANNGVAEANATVTPAPTLTEEQLTAFFKEKGIEYEGIDKLKEKINYVAPIEPSPEQKAEQAKAKEKRLVDLFVSGGGTVEQYVAIKGIAEANLSELSMNTLKKELKDAKFSDEQIEKIIKERYYQLTEDELEEIEEENKEIAKMKKEYGANKLANRSQHTKKQAQEILAGLNKAAESEDLEKQEEVTISSNIDEHFKKLPRKLNLEIGEINGKSIPPVEYEISDSDEKDLKELQSLLKNPAERNNILYNQNGGLNITKISDLLVENKLLKSQLKTVYHEGGSRQVAEFQKVFPARTAQELGVGGSPEKPTGEKGKPATFGKTQRVQPSTT